MSLRQLTGRAIVGRERQREKERRRWGGGWMDGWMSKRWLEEEEEDRKGNGRANDVEGKCSGDRRRAEWGRWGCLGREVWGRGGGGKKKCVSSFCPLGVAVSSQSGGLIRVRV